MDEITALATFHIGVHLGVDREGVRLAEEERRILLENIGALQAHVKSDHSDLLRGVGMHTVDAVKQIYFLIPNIRGD